MRRGFKVGTSERASAALARRAPGLRFLHREATSTTPAFDLAYVRIGPRSQRPGLLPAVVIPGGPGLGSVLPYGTLRRLAATRGLDLIMVEHRGVGLSRRDISGHDLPLPALRVDEVADDIAAVLERERVPLAHIVGSSYGSYLASTFGALYPERVAGMLLDSALQSAEHLEIERAAIRQRLWNAGNASSNAVQRLSSTGIDAHILLDVTRAAYELGGDELLVPLIQQRMRSPRSATWRMLEAYATRDASMTRLPGIYEFDLVGALAFRELGYGGRPDGLPLDPALTYAQLASHFPPFSGEPRNLEVTMASASWPLVLLSGSRDLRTPPAIAESLARAAPDAVLVPITNGHSALDTHPAALLNALAWLMAGKHRALPDVARAFDRLPRRGVAARFPELLSAVLRIERFAHPYRARATHDTGAASTT
ncbi:pimeloyl-ACP methyl ester carboxylesterase [Leucobacter luti]|nr:pimeloyl-ACP methyl ester carboxylesterase [Leucobacter luti]